MAENPDHDALISEFVAATGASPQEAQQYLATNHWDLNSAATEYFTSLEEGISGAQADAERGNESESEPYTGPRTLDGRPAPQSIPSVSSSRSTAPPKRGGFATLGSMGGEASNPRQAGQGHAHDDDDSDDEDFKPEGEPRDLFAGGEKSALAVQDPTDRGDPRKVVNDILKKARANAARPGGESSSAPPSKFSGSGQTLGGDDAPSQIVPNAHPQVPEQGPTQTRTLHIWEEGFSIEDGPLRRFDDPQNAADLQMIRQGRAPIHLMGVRPDQPIDVQLVKHEGKYEAPPKKYKPFSGSGQRLGSPTPGVLSTSTPPAASSTPSNSAPAPAPEPQIDSSQPIVTLRIQLASGTRLPARFNTTQTIGDVYDFINRAAPGSNERAWVLATTFPNKDHIDKSLALQDVAEFKRGGTAVQKWN